MDLTCSYQYFNSEMKTCRKVLQKVSDDMKYAKSNFEKKIHNNKQPIENSEQQNSCVAIHQSGKLQFSNIIGCTEAKQALYENVILPLTMRETDRTCFFQGFLYFNFIFM
jgi:uncharacterized protein YjaZ